MSRPLVLELFAGCGGAGLGIRAATPDALHVGIEWDHTACLTRKAAGLHTIRADVAQYPTEPFVGKVWGLWASPPCPDFSYAGKRKGIEGESGHLIFQVPRWVQAVRPEWVACEQVPGALPWWRQFAADFREQGYSCWTGVLDAANYGVPQNRKRAILMARLGTEAVQPPEPTHAKNPATMFGQLEPWTSMGQALGWGDLGQPSPTVTGGGTKTGGPEPIANGGRKRLTHTHTHTHTASLATEGRGGRA